jgi:CBS domain containing-hemolysin-like protein
MFSGLNLAFFSLTRLRLEIEAETAHTQGAKKVLAMRKDSNFLLTTILWGNVGINVLLTLLSDSIMAGVFSFAFSTVVITFFGEIIPQAYFSRNALRMASLLAPALRFYQILLFPVAKPCAMMLDSWLGKESVQFFSENNIKLFIKKHIDDQDSEIGDVEGRGAINFLSLDDKTAIEEGENIIPESIIGLKCDNNRIIFPPFENHLSDPFIQQINKSGEKWIIFTNEQGEPKLVLDADGFIRSELSGNNSDGIEKYCHIPVIVNDEKTNLDILLNSLKSKTSIDSDMPIDTDVILFWSKEHKRIITGADILGRLLKGI